jgi:hypothetical protein
VLASLTVTLVTAVVTVLVVGAGALAGARRRQPSLRPLQDFAQAQGWRFKRTLVPHRDTPFLRLGDDVEAGPGVALQILGLDVELYEHRRIRVDNETRAPAGSFVVLRLVDGLHLADVDQLRLMPRQTGKAATAALNDRRVVELESLEFEQRFLLEVGSGTSELTIRKLFTPALISGLIDLADADCYLGEYLDFSRGSLVFASGGTITAEDGPALAATVQQVTPLVRELLQFAGAQRG